MVVEEVDYYCNSWRELKIHRNLAVIVKLLKLVDTLVSNLVLPFFKKEAKL